MTTKEQKGERNEEDGCIGSHVRAGGGTRGQVSKVNRKTLTWGAFVACAGLVVLPSSATAQAGKLDATFGVRGIVTDSAGSFGTAVALQSDGKMVVGEQIAPEAAVLRLNTNGTLDSTFGSGGAVTISFPGDDFGGAQISGLAIQGDGKIVAVGSSLSSANPGSVPGGLVVARYLAQ